MMRAMRSSGNRRPYTACITKEITLVGDLIGLTKDPTGTFVPALPRRARSIAGTSLSTSAVPG
jgi:hypothetical protein